MESPQSKPDATSLLEDIGQKPILVTGATGYVASHTIKLLLEKGYKVRGTVRSLANKSKYEFLYNLVPEKKDNLTLVEAELLDPKSWPAVVDGCPYILHLASPIPPGKPKHEDDLIKPAVEGTVNVLNAALEKGAKRVVVTSSCLSLLDFSQKKVYDENDWATPEQYSQFAYAKSKVLAEKSAWEFYEKNKDKIEMIVVNPSIIYGPLYSKHYSHSEALVAGFFEGKYPEHSGPDDVIPCVDVRDVAEGEVRALLSGTPGKRYILSTTEVWKYGDIVEVLRGQYEKYGFTFPSKDLTGGHVYSRVNNQRSIDELQMKYHNVKDTIIAMGNSLIDQGTVSLETQK